MTQTTGHTTLPTPNNELISKYDSVHVLLLYWDADDLGVKTEVENLEALLSGNQFNFKTKTWKIPSESPREKLAERLMTFQEYKDIGDLLIVYYAGHGYGDEQRCMWNANRERNGPELCWHDVQGLILGGHRSDVLLILDCCFSTLAVSPNSGQGDNWFLGSSAKESKAIGVAWNSFTSIMIGTLKRLANLYFETGARFTLQDVHYDMSVWGQRDLKCSPQTIRLSPHGCDSTELTPVLRHQGVSRVQTLPMDADGRGPIRAMRLTLPDRPRTHHSTVPIPTGMMPPTSIPTASDPGPPVSINLVPGESQSIRLIGLPSTTNKFDIVHWLEDRLGQGSVIAGIGPLAARSSLMTVTVTLSSVALVKRALGLQDTYFKIRTHPTQPLITIDNTFRGLSCLFSSTLGPNCNPTVDIIFVHGANGHAINSFARHYTNPPKEVCWPREELPKALEAANIFPRILSYGWSANVWFDPQRSIDEEIHVFKNAFQRERSQSPKRPLVFVTGDIGGLLAKLVVTDIINFGLGEQDFENPVKSCFFFGVPHRGSEASQGFASILAKLMFGPDFDGEPGSSFEQAIRSRNRKITSLSNEFDDIRNEYSIKTVSFYEEQGPDGNPIVPQESAILDPDPGRSLAIGSIHSELTRLIPSSPDLVAVIKMIRDTISIDLGLSKPAKRKERAVAVEEVYPRLQGYDTVFLVDDSSSMDGHRWTTTSIVLSEIAKIAVQYDPDGCDIRFFNKWLSDDKRRNLDSAEKIMALFKGVTPRGETPTAEKLEEELGEFMRLYRKDRGIKGLNLIVLTDGAPSPRQDVEGVIVKYARLLAAAEAPEFKVGIQFVQIGADAQASKFLRTLDRTLKAKYELDRDVRSPSLCIYISTFN